jgi:Na+/H+ antiporter NhaD/arsenite permease-like protein
MLKGRFLVLLRIFFVVNFFFSKRMEEHRDLAKKKTERTTGKGAKVMVVRVLMLLLMGLICFSKNQNQKLKS